jgi:hypothetical protein
LRFILKGFVVSRRIRILFFVLLFAVVVTSWVVAQTETEQPDGNLVIPASIFVRGGPGDNFVAVGALSAGDEVTPLNRSLDGLWILIPYSRGYGWVQLYLIQWENFAALDLLPILEANVTPTPVVGTREPVLLPTFTPEGNYVLVVNAESAYLRAGPGRTYLRLGQLVPGNLVDPVSRSEDGEWILVRYLDTRTVEIRFAWIARDLVSWVDEAALDDLPIVGEDALTPTVTFTPSVTPEPSDTATATDVPTATDTATSTDTPSVTPSDTATATETPSITPSNTATVTDIPSITPSETATATETELPSLTPSDTVTATDIPSVTPSATATATDTAIPTDTATATDAPSITPSATATSTNTPTDEPTVVEALIVPTNTDVPSATPTDEPTATYTPSVTPSDTATATETPSITPSDTATATDTAIPTDTPTATETPSVTPSETATVTNTPTDVPTNTAEPSATPTSTDTVSPSATATTESSTTPTEEATQVAMVVLPTDIPTEKATEEALVLPETPIPTEPLIVETVPPDVSGGFTVPLEAIIGVVILLIVLGYIFLYWRGLVVADRYRDGFVIDECPVCKRGGLHVDEKPGRLLGIPQTRRTVRCDVCRSVLRETGAGRWRYAVDRIESPTMYDRFNGKEITDDELVRLAGNPPKSSTKRTNPQFLDEDNPDTSGR